MCTGLFNKRDIGRIEREFLDVLDFELRITEADILAHHEPVMALRRPQVPRLRIPTKATAATRPTFRYRSGSDSSTYTDDSSPTDSLPATPPASSMDVDAHVRSPSEGSSYSEDDEDVEASLPRLLSPHSKEQQKSKAEPVSLPRFSSAFNLLRNIPVPHFHAAT